MQHFLFIKYFTVCRCELFPRVQLFYQIIRHHIAWDPQFSPSSHSSFIHRLTVDDTKQWLTGLAMFLNKSDRSSVWVAAGRYRVHDPLGPLLFVRWSLLPCGHCVCTHTTWRYLFMWAICSLLLPRWTVQSVKESLKISRKVIQTFLALGLSFQ